jgi:hypothetical protein
MGGVNYSLVVGLCFEVKVYHPILQTLPKSTSFDYMDSYLIFSLIPEEYWDIGPYI